MNYQLEADFLDQDIARMALNKIQAQIPFPFAEIKANQKTDVNSNLKVSSFNEWNPIDLSAALRNPDTSINYSVLLAGEETLCKIASDKLKNLGAKNVKISKFE